MMERGFSGDPLNRDADGHFALLALSDDLIRFGERFGVMSSASWWSRTMLLTNP
jgi:hypothetical protein